MPAGHCCVQLAVPATDAKLPAAQRLHAATDVAFAASLAVPGGQGVQAAAPAADHEPAGHTAHACSPACAAKLPAAQAAQAVACDVGKAPATGAAAVPGGHSCVHVATPCTTLKDPGRQAWHTLGLVAPRTEEAVPAGHAWHEVAPGVLDQKPPAQSTHEAFEAAPGVVEAAPAGHRVQAPAPLAPRAAEYEPGLQATQDERDKEPRSADHVPAGHGEQVAWPASSA